MKKAKTYSPPSGGGKKFSKKRLYESISWIEYRVLFLTQNPLCYCCGKPARIVDHIVAHKESTDKFWNETNYVPLCKVCHDVITGTFDRHNPPKTEEKMRWMASQRIKNEISIKVKIVKINKLKLKNPEDMT